VSNGTNWNNPRGHDEIAALGTNSPCRISVDAPCSANVRLCSQRTNRATQKSMSELVISGLIKRRAELAGDIEKHP
jgi:hypothetical protein